MSRLRSIYISRSKGISNTLLLNFKRQLSLWYPKAEITYWDENTDYNEKLLSGADRVFVLVESDAIVGRGVYSEVTKCMQKGIPIHLAYRRSTDGNFQLYKFDIERCHNSSNNWSHYGRCVFGLNITTSTTVDKGYVTYDYDIENLVWEYPLRPEDCIVKENTINSSNSPDPAIANEEEYLLLLYK